MDLIWFLILLVIVVIVVSIIWQAFGVSSLFANMTPTQRLLFALLGLLIVIVVLWWFFGSYIPLPASPHIGGGG